MSEQDAAPQVGETYPLSTLRHSVAHLMASAVGKLYPGVQFGIGPSIEHGFYYDFEFPEPITEKDLKRIEKEMYKTARKDAEISCESLTRDQARERLLANGQEYKVDLLDSIPEDEEITFYGHGEWADLC